MSRHAWLFRYGKKCGACGVPWSEAIANDPCRSRRVRCAHHWERQIKGKKYVNNRGQCRSFTAHPSGYCATHRYEWRLR
jgi:hypothetical protein